MDQIDKALEEWRGTLCESVDVGGLFSKKPIVHKWKAPFRSLSLREAVSWRLQDLVYQSKLLLDRNQLLGARIVLRSAFETLAVLIYLNQLMRKVVSGEVEFYVFSDKTTTLLLGSRDDSTPYKSLNIVTILQKCDSKYPGLFEIYEGLCESAHPNHEGLSGGYSKVDHKNFVTHYSNRWGELFSTSQKHGIVLCMSTFTHEYNDEWQDAMLNLEEWVEENDNNLKKGKYDA
ncbi:MAG: hypothetical protein SV201_02395 [Pseudomonadota bacterium]|nr:hypothetical protein [Pseudomonadota bacterium]